VTKTNALEALVIAGFVRGVSTRDIEATLVEVLGEQAAVSRSTLSRVCEQIKIQFDAWCARRLDEVELDYLFLDGSHFKYHANAAAEPCWPPGASTPRQAGVRRSGGRSQPVRGRLGGVLDRARRSRAGLPAAGRLRRRAGTDRRGGARDGRRATSNIHRCRNLLVKVSKNAQAEVNADYWAIFEVPQDMAPGLNAVAYVQKRIDSFAVRWRDSYPTAVRALLADRESLTVYLRFPRQHWARVRHCNFIECTFGESRRRVKVIARLPGEHSCLKLVWAVLDRASTGWRGFTQTPAGLRMLQDLRRSLLQPPTHLTQRHPAPARHPQKLSGRSHSINRIKRSLQPGFYTAPGTPPMTNFLIAAAVGGRPGCRRAV
jgi:putative transposase